MTRATLSFALPGVVSLRCADAGLDERRALEGAPPFAGWAAAYGAGATTDLRALGAAIGRWLDGGQGWLSRLAVAVVPPLVLDIEVAPDDDGLAASVLAAPWELAAIGEGGQVRHLARDPSIRLGVVRRVGAAGVARPPQPSRLSIVFMAALPGGIAGLDVDRRDCELLDAVEDVARATEALGVDLAVEESGAVGALTRTAQGRAADVVHLAGAVDPASTPGLVFEVERDGERRVLRVGALAGAVGSTQATVTTATELRAQFAGYVPSLLVLPLATSIADAVAGQQVAATLCRQGWPAVLAWAAPVAEREARELACSLYRQLAARGRLDVAMADARAGSPPWHQARLFLGPAGGDRLVSAATAREIRVAYSPSYLDDARAVGVWRPAELFGYRGAIQVTVAALREADPTAVAIHGAGARLRASLAARTAAAIEGLRRVVITRKQQDSAAELLAQVARTSASAEIDRRVRAYLAEPAATRPRLAVFARALLEGPAQRKGQGAVLLVVHDLRGVRPRMRAGRAELPHAPPVIAELIEAFVGAATESRLLLTSARRFAVYTVGGAALAGAVRFAPVAAIVPAPLSRPRARARTISTAVATACLAAVVIAAVPTGEGAHVVNTASLLCLASALLAAGAAVAAHVPVSPRAAAGPGAAAWMIAAAFMATAPMVFGASWWAAAAFAASPTASAAGPTPPAASDAAVDAPDAAGATDGAGVIVAAMRMAPSAATDASIDAVADARRTRPIDAAERETDVATVDAEEREPEVVAVDAAAAVIADAAPDVIVDAAPDVIVDAANDQIVDAKERPCGFREPPANKDVCKACLTPCDASPACCETCWRECTP